MSYSLVIDIALLLLKKYRKGKYFVLTKDKIRANSENFAGKEPLPFGTYLKYILIYWKVFSALFLLVLCFLVGISLWRKFLCQPIRIQVFVFATKILPKCFSGEKRNYSGSFHFALVKVHRLISLRDKFDSILVNLISD